MFIEAITQGSQCDIFVQLHALRVIVQRCERHYDSEGLTHSSVLSHIQGEDVLLAWLSDVHQCPVIVGDQQERASLLTGCGKLLIIRGAPPNICEVGLRVVL